MLWRAPLCMRSTRPHATPSETATPRQRRSRLSLFLLIPFPEPARDEAAHRVQSLALVLALGRDEQLRAARGREHQDAQYGLGVGRRAAVCASEPERASVVRRCAHELRRRPRVQAQTVDDPYVALDQASA